MAADRGYYNSEPLCELRTGTVRRFVPILAICLAATSGWAGGPKSVTWGDLGQGLRGTDNPYYGLTADEAHLLGLLVDIDDARASGEKLSEKQVAGEQIAIAALESVGIDGNAKVEAVSQFGEQLAQSRVALNQELLGQNIEIPGYALPLAFDGVKVTEFLLVPYAGACIHTPPPPSNQIIHIKSPDGFAMRGLFDPVVVKGELSASGRDMDVSLSDGEAEFPVGYQITSNSIALYQ